MTTAPSRPFYGEFAWAYDHLIPRPVAAECAGVAATLARRGLAPDATVLDAGCGSGRYALELARLGYRVTGLDRSPELLDEARRAAEAAPAPAHFVRGDLLALPPRASYDAILARGVLNDLVEDSERDAVFPTFAGALGAGGVLLLDVRDWEATAADRITPARGGKAGADAAGSPHVPHGHAAGAGHPASAHLGDACARRRERRDHGAVRVHDAVLDARGAGGAARPRRLRGDRVRAGL